MLNHEAVGASILGKSRIPITIRKHCLILCAIVFLIATVLFVRPFERFPINDEWAYGFPVLSYCQSSKFIFPTTTTLALVPILFAAAAAKLFGFSFALLRLIGVLSGVLALVFFVLTLREIRVGRTHCGLFGLILVSNPFFLNLSNSFMTDVPATALIFGFILFFLRGIKRNKVSDWLASGIFLSAAAITRQTALLYLLPIAATLLLRAKSRSSDKLPIMMLLLIPLVSYIGANWFVNESSIITKPSTSYQLALLGSIKTLLLRPMTVWNELSWCGSYLGYFCLPAVLPMLLDFATLPKLKNWSKWLITAFWLVGIPALLLALRQNVLMPYSPNLFFPPLLGVYCLIGRMNFLPTPYWVSFWTMGFTIICIACSVSFVAALLRGCNDSVFKIDRYFDPASTSWRREFAVFQICSILTLVAFVLLQLFVHNLDRYYLLLLPNSLIVLSMLWSQRATRHQTRLALALTCVMAFFGFLELLDTHNFAKAKEKCILSLENQGVNPTEIDGGPEYNLFSNWTLLKHYQFDSSSPGSAGYSAEIRGSNSTRNLRWWPITGENYIISFSELPGYKIVYACEYWSPITGCRIPVLAEKKTPER